MVAERRRQRQADMTEADDRNAHEMVPETTSGTRPRDAPALARAGVPPTMGAQLHRRLGHARATAAMSNPVTTRRDRRERRAG